MKNKFGVLLLFISVSLVSCAHLNNPHPMDMSQAIQNAKIPSDHEALAKHYEDTAKEMQSKVQEHKKMLEQYEAQRQFYGKRGMDMESMCKALIQYYGQAAEMNMEMAKSHRKMAVDTK